MTISRILRTKLIPPPPNTRTLVRPRVIQSLRQALDYRLTILQAEAGYGKSTALAELASELPAAIWYQATEEDDDPLVFLLQLCHALQQVLPSTASVPTRFLEAWEEVADLLDIYAADFLASGRIDTLASYIDALPSSSLHQHPVLMFTLGELARVYSRFEEALGWYSQAELTWRTRGQQDGVARALRGQARVYLDTLNPSHAEHLLEEAIRLSDGFEDREAQVRLYELLAENKLNAGHVAEAERLRQRAEYLRLEGPSNDQLWFRVLLRTGRLQEARRGLEDTSPAEGAKPAYYGAIRHIQTAEEINFNEWQEAVDFM